MKKIIPVFTAASAIALFALSSANFSVADARVPASSSADTFEQLELFADVMARVRNEYVVDVEDSNLIAEAMNGMLQSLDPHSNYIRPEDYKNMQISTKGEYGGLGMEVTSETGVVKVISPIDDTPAKRAGIEAGDYLTEIDGKSIIGLPLNEAVEQMRGKPGEPITVTVIRGEEDPMEITMVREIINSPVVKYEIKDGIAYFRISQFNGRSASSLDKAISDLGKELKNNIPGVILDLRGNPGGLLDQSIKISSTFLNGGEVVSTRGRRANDVHSYNAKKGERLKGVPVIVLIDGASASASEIVAGALQDHGRALLVGLTTFGKGSVQEVIALNGGRDGALRLTTQRYYTPSGKSIQGTGIDPDIAIAARPDDGKGNKSIQESDLPNSILNELEETETETVSEQAIDYPPEGFEVEDDYQLQRALQILRDGTYQAKMTEAG